MPIVKEAAVEAALAGIMVRNDHYHRIVIHSIPLQSIDETGKGFLENSHAAEIHHFPTAGFGLHTIHMPMRFRIIIRVMHIYGEHRGKKRSGEHTHSLQCLHETSRIGPFARLPAGRGIGDKLVVAKADIGLRMIPHVGVSAITSTELRPSARGNEGNARSA